ncbi:hypothetical protein SAMN04487770_12016 [Butyrivibrio sp. ob235]|uniref:hypothetical protein n=1 Tax=Butyrivibrio sp. ob235 TaxID=1761780 RepID=UPI0008B7591B|nr:hypothetical protein [Butyrivibrio sp. ob235]SEL89343.1 hypothetical protein SAMN04487770_12016 [Butyrivibrio sp. ob235]
MSEYYTEASAKASKKYRDKNIKRIPLDVQNAEYETIKKHAESRNEKINGFIKRAIRETIERDNKA